MVFRVAPSLGRGLVTNNITATRNRDIKYCETFRRLSIAAEFYRLELCYYDRLNLVLYSIHAIAFIVEIQVGDV